MPSDEQRVRTMAGWIGVEISRSRVRTPGKAGYGLYRARGTEMAADPGVITRTPRWTEWTAYAFTLETIRSAIDEAIRVGIPAAPADLWLHPADGSGPVGVTTRWTSAYTGKRNLGLQADLEALERTDTAVGAAAARLDEAVREIVTRSTTRRRQRAENDEFQAAHLRRRAYGLRQRHAAKLARNPVSDNGPET